MGQRSQIYVRVKDSNHTYLIARYYWWNYGERMVSRARYAIQWLQEKFKEVKSEIPESYLLPMMVRILDTNFDKFDCQISTCLIKEWAADFMDEDFREYIFCHGNNNNGRLFLDVDITQKSVKYAFLDDKVNLEQLMDAEAYMAWDIGEHEDWRLPLDDEECQYTEQNIAYIKDHAALMSREELEDFMAFDPAYLSTMQKENGVRMEVKQTAGDEHNEWISMAERQPTFDDIPDFADEDWFEITKKTATGKSIVSAAVWTGDYFSLRGSKVLNVTHWKPMSAPPKEDE